MLQTIDQTFILGYIILVLIIGYLCSRKQTGEDFMIAGRSLDLFSFVSTITASFIGGGTIVVYTAYVYEFGLGVLSGFVGLALGFVLFSVLAKPLRALAKEKNFHTISDFFHHCFGRKTGLFTALLFLVTTGILIINQFIAGTRILSAVSGYSYEVSLVVSASVVLIYLILGGFRSVVKTDIFQYLVLIFLLFVIGISMVSSVDITSISKDELFTSPSLMIAFFILGFLAMWPSTDLWQRIYAAKNDDVVRKGSLYAGAIMLLIGIFISLIAYTARVAFPNIDPAEAMVYGMVNLLPSGLLGLGIVLLFAAIMSSADTIIFALASIVAKDFIHHKRENKSSGRLMKDTKIAIVLIVLGTTALAYFYRDIVNLALIQTGLALSVVPAIIASFKWKIPMPIINSSIIVGVLTVIAWMIAGNISAETMITPVLTAGVFVCAGGMMKRSAK